MDFSKDEESDNSMISNYTAASDSSDEDKDEEDLNNLMYNAAEKGQSQIICQLVQRGADVNSTEVFSGMTPLMLAAEKGHTETTEVLLSLNADPCKMGINNDLPLHYAAKGGHVDICEILLKKEPQHLDQANEDGNAPIHVAAINNCTAVLKLLIGMGAKLSQPNISGRTPLLIATENGFPRARKILENKQDGSA